MFYVVDVYTARIYRKCKWTEIAAALAGFVEV